jgi:hypothetical protein
MNGTQVNPWLWYLLISTSGLGTGFIIYSLFIGGKSLYIWARNWFYYHPKG